MRTRQRMCVVLRRAFTIAVCILVLENQILFSAGVLMGGGEISPVSPTILLGALSQSSGAGAAQKPLPTVSFDEYLASIGASYIPFQASCTKCYDKAVVQVNAITDASTEYTKWVVASQDVAFEKNN